jgi:hypothetical protein
MQQLTLKGVNGVPLNLRERQAVVRELAQRYQRASKKAKGQLLDHLQALTDFNRSYAARILCKAGSIEKQHKKPRPGCGRKPQYDDAVLHVLRTIWAILDFPAGKRLAPFLPEIVPILEQHGEVELLAEVRSKLLTISAASIDRLLASERKRQQLKGRSGTKPGSLLKNAIPIKTFADWDDARPGFIEIDLVAHDGGNSRGDYVQTLDAVDVATNWTETRAVKNKAQCWVFEALQNMTMAFPFPILGIDSDNGSEFINAHFVRYCEEQQITFTRARPYRKNDSCHVEQKNWSVVRKAVGYLRYDQPEQLELLNQLYGILRLYTNYFQPVLKLTKKERHGSKVKKIYDQAKTPYQRVLNSPTIPEERKIVLQEQYTMINPAKLKRQILSLQEMLFKSTLTTPEPQMEALTL